MEETLKKIHTRQVGAIAERTKLLERGEAKDFNREEASRKIAEIDEVIRYCQRAPAEAPETLRESLTKNFAPKLRALQQEKAALERGIEKFTPLEVYLIITILLEKFARLSLY